MVWYRKGRLLLLGNSRHSSQLYLVKKAAAAILSSILKSSSIFFSSNRLTFFKSSIPSNEWKLFPVSSLTTVGNLVFVFALWRLVSIQAKIAEADRRPWRTAPLCNRAHIGSRFRNKYAIFPMAVWSAISFNLLHVDLIYSSTDYQGSADGVGWGPYGFLISNENCSQIASNLPQVISIKAHTKVPVVIETKPNRPSFSDCQFLE